MHRPALKVKLPLSLAIALAGLGIIMACLTGLLGL